MHMMITDIRCLLNRNIIRHVDEILYFGKTLNCDILSKKSAGVPKLGKSRALTGVSLEIHN